MRCRILDWKRCLSLTECFNGGSALGVHSSYSKIALISRQSPSFFLLWSLSSLFLPCRGLSGGPDSRAMHSSSCTVVPLVQLSQVFLDVSCCIAATMSCAVLSLTVRSWGRYARPLLSTISWGRCCLCSNQGAPGECTWSTILGHGTCRSVHGEELLFSSSMAGGAGSALSYFGLSFLDVSITHTNSL